MHFISLEVCLQLSQPVYTYIHVWLQLAHEQDVVVGLQSCFVHP